MHLCVVHLLEFTTFFFSICIKKCNCDNVFFSFVIRALTGVYNKVISLKLKHYSLEETLCVHFEISLNLRSEKKSVILQV